LLWLALALVYYPVLSAPFVWTDHAEIEQGALVPKNSEEFWATLLQAKGLAKTTVRTEYINQADGSSLAYHRPVKALSYGLDHVTGAGQPWSYHLSNLVFHGLCCMMILLLVRRLWGRQMPGLAEVLALWHALNPLHTESVAWISARSDSLMTLFILIALALQLAARRARGWSWPFRILGALCIVAAIGTKESGMVAVGLAWLVALCLPRDRPADRGPLRQFAREAGLPLLAGGLALVFRLSVVADLDMALLLGRSGIGLWTGLDLFGRNLLQSFLPLGTGVADTIPILTGPSLLGLLGPTAFGLWLLVGWRLRREAPAIGFAALAWLAAILPVSQLITLIHPRGDRYLYLPALFSQGCMVAGLFWSLQRLQTLRLARAGLALLAIVGLFAAGVISSIDARIWSDERHLFGQAARNEPRCAECWNNLAYAEAQAGRYAHAASACEQGLRIDRALVHTARDGFSLRFILAKAALLQGQGLRAAQALQEIHIKAGPRAATLRMLSKAYAMRGRVRDARFLLKLAEGDADPSDPSADLAFRCTMDDD